MRNRALLSRIEKLEPRPPKVMRRATVLHVRSAHCDEDKAMLLGALTKAGKPYFEGDPLIVISALDYPGYPTLGANHVGIDYPGLMS
jgi:hypothetical protein